MLCTNPFLTATVARTRERSASWSGHMCEYKEYQARGIRGAAVPTKAKLTYFQDRSLSLSLQYKSDETWTECFTVTHTSSSPISIPTVAYLGFSAETGELSDNHDIISIESRNLYNPTQYTDSGNTGSGNREGKPARRKKPARHQGDSEGGGWSWFFLKMVIFLIVIAGAYVGYTAWRAQQRNRF
jgi:mannose-binding lectin 2